MPRGNQKAQTGSNTKGRFKIRQTTPREHSKQSGSYQVTKADPRPPR